MSVDVQEPASAEAPTELKRAITGRLLYFYVLGDVLGSGIYVLVGVVAALLLAYLTYALLWPERFG